MCIRDRPCAVRSAADRLYLRGNAELQHGAFRLIDEEHAGLDFLLHVIVARCV